MAPKIPTTDDVKNVLGELYKRIENLDAATVTKIGIAVLGLGGTLTTKAGKAAVKTALGGVTQTVQGTAGGAAKAGGLSAIKNPIQTAITQMQAIDELNVAYVRLTGQTQDHQMAVSRGQKGLKTHTEQVMSVQRANALLGATYKSVSEDLGNLFTGSRAFGLITAKNTKENQKLVGTLATLAGQMTALGFDTKAYAQGLDVLDKLYKRDLAKSSKVMVVNLKKIADATGQGAGVVQSQWIGAMDVLGAYDYEDQWKVFNKLSAQAASTGLEMGKLTSAVAKFDTFEGAANAVGDLNAMLGGPYLNTLDLINADEGERVAMLQDMMTQGDMTWASMSRFQKKAVAQALGMGVQDAGKMLQGTREEMEGLVETAGASELTYEQAVANLEKLNKGAKKNAVTINAQLQGVIESATNISSVFENMNTSVKSILTKFGTTLPAKIRSKLTPALGTFTKIFSDGLKQAAGELGEGNFAKASVTLAFAQGKAMAEALKAAGMPSLARMAEMVKEAKDQSTGEGENKEGDTEGSTKKEEKAPEVTQSTLNITVNGKQTAMVASSGQLTMESIG